MNSDKIRDLKIFYKNSHDYAKSSNNDTKRQNFPFLKKRLISRYFEGIIGRIFEFFGKMGKD